jgi:hypothetical protein
VIGAARRDGPARQLLAVVAEVPYAEPFVSRGAEDFRAIVAELASG